MRAVQRFVLCAAATLLVSACGQSTKPCSGSACNVVAPGTLVHSDLQRNTDPAVASADLDTLVSGNTGFALDLYAQVRGLSGNLVFSPYSISTALAMTYAGARANTAAEMAGALHFDLPQATLHPAFDRLDLDLAAHDGKGFKLNVLNQLWGNTGSTFESAFLDTLAVSYGAGLRLLDFATDPDGSRQQINDWIAAVTNQRILNLLPRGTINGGTRLVLTNAIYFDAKWASPFDANDTSPAPFYLADGATHDVPFMNQQGQFPYFAAADYQAIALPYAGGAMSMLIMVPDVGSFDAFEGSLTAQTIDDTVAQLTPTSVNLALPKFSFSTPLPVVDALKNLGMHDAFDPTRADFSGISQQFHGYISAVLHKAFVAVDEAGTEAAAATAVVVGVTGVRPSDTTLQIDRPFIFVIRDNTTGAVLFIGRVVDPQS